jgi:prepilin-type N-terminal cleavage/methylation domain-containing protein
MKNAFTLIELLIVVAIIGILATALVPTLSDSQGKARDVARVASVKDAVAAAESYLIDNSIYPAVSECAPTAFGSLYSKPALPNAVDEDCPHPYYKKLYDGYAVIVALEGDGQANSCYQSIADLDGADSEAGTVSVARDLISDAPPCTDTEFYSYTVVR